MTDDQTRTLVERNTGLSRDMLRHAHLVTTDQAEQAVALLTAATVLIERIAGRDRAADTLISMIAPTIGEWVSPAKGQARQ
jgi:hypothetical protein